ncbi:double-strand-break repair protein rad21-like protein 1 isoform X2 [Electrophorus electricus]|uniref:double-strand-break repair protein rad21-like protein 1 isoform X2 n=1 Tax=Electrophorus electricus TaxID=8005 RepID=UPI0015CFD91D|nr:double-strand-break repair protein rad21-like protein 1 isoform X2 [Electrophorus electricus]
MVFFTELFSYKRGSLAKIWLAAHWEKKITKAHVFECNLETTVEDIISPQIKIGLRTSGHLLLGVARIYSRKTKYLLADCSDAVVKIKVAFRPGQTDLPEEGMEAMFKAVTLPEDFTDFQSQLPDLNTIDVVDHFSLHQCHAEEITLKENIGNSFLTIDDVADDTLSHQGLFDLSFHSLASNGDRFGDEGMAYDAVDLIVNANDNALLTDSCGHSPEEFPATPPPTAVNVPETLLDSPSHNETTLLDDAEKGFTLESVAVTPSSDRKRGNRKRKLVVDQYKELSNDTIRAQLNDCSDILASLDMAPPTRQLLEWKENGGADYLFSHFCIPVTHSDLQQLFPRDVFPGRRGLTRKAREESDFENTRELGREDCASSVVSLVEELSLLEETMDPGRYAQEESRLEVTCPELLSEDSILVHPSGVDREILLTQTQTQSTLDSQDMEEKRMTSRAQILLQVLKEKENSNLGAAFSLHTLCARSSRSEVAATFFALLLLKKQRALDLYQSDPYSDIIATPGPFFYKPNKM